MIKHSKRVLIITMSALVLIVLGIASLYYESQNKKVDPRVIKARELYKKYDDYAANNNYPAVFHLLDSVENIYKKFTHYQKSYEIAVLENNRGAAYLSLAINNSGKPVSLDGVKLLSKDSLLIRSKYHLEKAITIYENWLKTYEKKDEAAIRELIQPNFFIGLNESNQDKANKYMENRIKEIQDAQVENKRRLSVALTNLGIIFRHEEKYLEAIALYEEALELWDRNLAATNNRNILLGKPIEKRNFIQKLFPPEKDEE